MKILIKFLEETSSRKILTSTINNSYYLEGEGQRFHSNHYQKKQIKKITEDLMAEVVKNTSVTKEKGIFTILINKETFLVQKWLVLVKVEEMQKK